MQINQEIRYSQLDAWDDVLYDGWVEGVGAVEGDGSSGGWQWQW